jgi:predicted nucleic acid-binding protein
MLSIPVVGWNTLPMADSIILYSARHHGAKLWTQDAHFDSVEGVCFVRKGGQVA